MGMRTWEPRPHRVRDKEALPGRGVEMSPAPSSPPLPSHPCWGANPGTSTPCGVHHHRALPRNEPPLAPADPPRPQTTRFPWAPSPAGGAAGKPPNARLPWRVAAGRKERKRKGEAGTEASIFSPLPLFHPQNPLVGFPSSFLCFHCS